MQHEKDVMADFTPTQGRYLAFIRAETNLHGYPPAESEIAAAICVSPPSVNLMVKSQFGKRPFDPDGRKYGLPSGPQSKLGDGDASATKLDELGLNEGRAFGYWFDFGDDWYHQVQVDRIEQAIPTVTYPRVIRRVGKSPPQYCDE